MASSYAQEHRRYALVWHDEFDSGTLDNTVWSKIWRSKADWATHMSSNDALYAIDDGNLVMRGVVNDFLKKDTASVLTGGVWTRNRKTFGFGRVEVRAKFDVAQGYWPAIWMLPSVNKDLNWPYGGEIDIMEHFDGSLMVDQTIHTDYTVNQGKRNRPPQSARSAYHIGDYNTYGMERFQDSLVFFVNGNRTFNYPRYRKGVNGQFPFSQHDYYLIMDVQLGRKGGPKIDMTSLPVELRIDYVRYYELDSKTDIIPEPKEYQQLGTKMKKLRKVVYDKNTHFDNPDEYRLVVKCGKAKISGNRQWAESTLAQLVDGNGYVSNLEIHDWATCPTRGVVLGKSESRWSADAIMELLDKMAFYKLNRLQWDDAAAYSADEVARIKEHANELGIVMAPNLMGTFGVDVLKAEGQTAMAFMNNVFLQKAASKGGVLGLENQILKDAMMAFSERYWRGGDAGDKGGKNNAAETLTPAGSRLSNFKEKVAIHRQRFH